MTEPIEEALEGLLKLLTPSGRVTKRRGLGGEAPPPALILGRACAEAAGLPGATDIARQAFEDPDLQVQYLGEGDPEDDDAVLAALRDYLAEMTPAQRLRFLQSFYASLPIPPFYHDLALLVKTGVFRRLLLIGVDNLLERALSEAGLWPGQDFTVLNLSDPREQLSPKFLVSPPEETLILKLPPDEYLFTSEQEALEKVLSAFLKDLNVIVVGYGYESQVLTEQLGGHPELIYWVGVSRAEAGRLRRLRKRRPFAQLSGPTAMPENFFNRLVYYLIRRPWLQEAPYPPREIDELAEEGGARSAEETPALAADETPPAAAAEKEAGDPLKQLLRGEMVEKLEQIWQRSVQQRPAPASRQAEAALPTDLLGVLEAVVTAIGRSPAARDPHLVGYLELQLNAARQELERANPNPLIVRGVRRALTEIATEMEAGVVPPELLQRLRPETEA